MLLDERAALLEQKLKNMGERKAMEWMKKKRKKWAKKAGAKAEKWQKKLS